MASTKIERETARVARVKVLRYGEQRARSKNMAGRCACDHKQANHRLVDNDVRLQCMAVRCMCAKYQNEEVALLAL